MDVGIQNSARGLKIMNEKPNWKTCEHDFQLDKKSYLIACIKCDATVEEVINYLKKAANCEICHQRKASMCEDCIKECRTHERDIIEHELEKSVKEFFTNYGD